MMHPMLAVRFVGTERIRARMSASRSSSAVGLSIPFPTPKYSRQARQEGAPFVEVSRGDFDDSRAGLG